MMEQTSSTSKHVSTGQRVTKWQKCQEWALANENIYISADYAKHHVTLEVGRNLYIESPFFASQIVNLK
jgi:hypothetical protein